MIKRQFSKRYFTGLIFLSLLNGCNGGGSNDSDEVDAHSDKMPPQATSFVKRISKSYQNELDFNNYIYDEDINSIQVKPEIRSGSCELKLKIGTKFSVSSERNELCSIHYKVTNKSGLITEEDAAVLSVSGAGGIQYPVLANYAAVKDTPLTIDVISDLLSKDPTLDFSGKIIGEFFTTGMGSAFLDSGNTKITFTGSDFGVASILYTIIDEATSMFMGYGRIDIAISSSFNSQPEANSAEFSKIVKPNVEYLVDLNDFTPSIISDPDSDELQLIDFKTYEGSLRLDPVDALNVNNKRFYVKFPPSSANVHDVSYTVTDHKGGYATNVIRFKIDSPSASLYWRDIYYKGYKRFIAPLTKEIMQTIYPPISGSYTEDDLIPDNSVEVSAANFDDARDYCISRGARLPRREEFINLYNLNGDISVSDKWPYKAPYWLDDATAFVITDKGLIETISDTTELYVTCVKGGLESYYVEKDNSAADNNEKNIIRFLLKDVYGIPSEDEMIVFDANGSSDITFESPSLTDSNGFSSAEFKSVSAGEFTINGHYVDDMLSAQSIFSEAKRNSIVILPSSDSCQGKCTVFKYGAAEIANVDIKVREDGTTNGVEGVNVVISSSSDSVEFSSDYGLSWHSSPTCTSSTSGLCNFKLRLTKPLAIANFTVQIDGSGSSTRIDDFTLYTALTGLSEGSFDRQRLNDGSYDNPEKPECTMLDDAGHTVSDTQRLNAFALALEDDDPSPISFSNTNFSCFSDATEHSDSLAALGFIDARTCKNLTTVHFDTQERCKSAQFWEDAGEANSTFALTGSGDRLDGDNRALMVLVPKKNRAPNGTGFNYKVDKIPPEYKNYLINIDFDLYVVGNKFTSGQGVSSYPSDTSFTIGLHTGLPTTDANRIYHETKEFDTESKHPWEHKHFYFFISEASSPVSPPVYVSFIAKASNSSGDNYVKNFLFIDNFKVTLENLAP